MYQVVHNQEIISKIAQDYYKEHGLNLDEAPQVGDDKNFISKLYNTSKIPELYAQIFPYTKYENFNIYRAELEKFSKHKDFPQIFKDSVLTNSDLFKDYSFNIVYLHALAKDYLDEKTLSSLENSIFHHINPKPLKEVEIGSVSYLIDKTSFYSHLDNQTLISTGQSQVTEFIKALQYDLGIIEKLKIDRLINYQIIEVEPKNIQLVIINPRDKKLLDAFIEELPTIFKHVFNSFTSEQKDSCKYAENMDVIHKAIDHLSLSQKLGNKENITLKPKKI